MQIGQRLIAEERVQLGLSGSGSVNMPGQEPGAAEARAATQQPLRDDTTHLGDEI